MWRAWVWLYIEYGNSLLNPESQCYLWELIWWRKGSMLENESKMPIWCDILQQEKKFDWQFFYVRISKMVISALFICPCGLPGVQGEGGGPRGETFPHQAKPGWKRGRQGISLDSIAVSFTDEKYQHSASDPNNYFDADTVAKPKLRRVGRAAKRFYPNESSNCWNWHKRAGGIVHPFSLNICFLIPK